MRKLIVGLIAVGLLAGAAPAQAQTADPLGLIASGAVIPYVGTTSLGSGIAVVNSLTGAITATVQNTGSLAILEVASPVGSNAGPEENIFGSPPFHMFFFDQSCVRVGPSVGNPLTRDDADLINLNLLGGIPPAGLIAAAAVDNSGGVTDVLRPLANGIHARVYWINAVDGVLSRVLEPISVRNADNEILNIPLTLLPDWNPLRTAATFTAPLEGSGVHTTLYLICPTRNIIPGVFPEVAGPGVVQVTTTAVIGTGSIVIPAAPGANLVQFEPSGTAYIIKPDGNVDAFTYTAVSGGGFSGVAGVGGVYPVGTVIANVPIPPPGAGFPSLRPKPVPGVSATPLFMRVFDDEENFRRNIDIFCRCLGAHPVAEIDAIYSNPIEAPRGTYTEVEGFPACANDGEAGPSPCSFTGYRSIRWGNGAVGNDVFGRLSNGSFLSIRGLDPVNLPGFPFSVPIR